MKKRFVFLFILFICHHLWGQVPDVSILEKNGNETNVSIEDIKKLAFTPNKTAAFVLEKTDNTTITTHLTAIRTISFVKAASHVKEMEIQNHPVIKNFHLNQNYPNPFNPATTIEYTLLTAGTVVLQIYNVDGQLVRTLISQDCLAGTHQIRWDGTNNSGQNVTNGVYFYRLQFNQDIQTRKLIFLK